MTTTDPTSTTTAAEASLTANRATLDLSDPARPDITLAGSGFAPSSVVTLMISRDGTVVGAVHDIPVAADGTALYTVGDGTPLQAGTYVFEMSQPTDAGSNVATTEVVVHDGSAIASPDAPQASAIKPTFAPDEAIHYSLTNFTAGADITLLVAGPVTGEFEAAVDGDGTYSGEILYSEYDSSGIAIGRLDFPVGTYTVQVEEPSTGNAAEFSFAVVQADGPSAATSAPTAGARPSSDRAGDDLASTGAEGVFGVAGLGLLLATAGIGVIAVRRRFAAKAD